MYSHLARVLSLLLITVLLSPSVTFAIEGAMGGSAGGYNADGSSAGYGGYGSDGGSSSSGSGSGSGSSGGGGGSSSGSGSGSGGGYSGGGYDSPSEGNTSGPGGGANSGGGFGPSADYSGYGGQDSPSEGKSSAGPGTQTSSTDPAEAGRFGPVFSNEDSRASVFSPTDVTDIADFLSTIENPSVIGIPTTPVSPIGVVNTPTVTGILSPQTTATTPTNQTQTAITDDLGIDAGRFAKSFPTSFTPATTPPTPTTPLSYYSPILGTTVTLDPIPMADSLSPTSHSTFATPMSFNFADPQDPNSNAASYDLGNGNTMSIDPLSGVGTISDEDGKVLGYYTADETMSMVDEPDVTVATPAEVGVLSATLGAVTDAAKAAAEATAAGLRGMIGWLGLDNEEDDSRVVQNPPGTVADPFGNKVAKDESKLAADDTNPFAAPTTVAAPTAVPASVTGIPDSTTAPTPTAAPQDTTTTPAPKSDLANPDDVFSPDSGRFPGTAPAQDQISLPDTAPAPTPNPGNNQADTPGAEPTATPSTPSDSPSTDDTPASPSESPAPANPPSSQPNPAPNQNDDNRGGVIDFFRDLLSGDGPSDATSTPQKLCPPYPVSCDEDQNGNSAYSPVPSGSIHGRQMTGVAYMGLVDLEPIKVTSKVIDFIRNLFSKKDPETDTSTSAINPEYVPVLVTVNYQTNEIDIKRPDITNSLKDPALYYSKEQMKQMAQLLNETPFLFGPEGEVIYSNGLYSPPVKNGNREKEDVPKYVYAFKVIDQNGKEIVNDEGGPALSSDLVTKIANYVLGNASEFNINAVKKVTYYLDDPDENIERDEYYQYSIELKDGSLRHVTIPQFSSIAHISKRFSQIGFVGDAISIITVAEEVPAEITGGGLLSSIRNFFGQKLEEEAGTDYPLPSFETFKSDISAMLANDIERVLIYTNTDVPCPTDLPEYSSGFMYKAVIKDAADPDYMIVISDGRCGQGEPIYLASETAKDLANHYNVLGANLDSIRNKTYTVSERAPFSTSVSRVFVGDINNPLDETTTTIGRDKLSAPSTEVVTPNRTNAVTLEVKATSGDGKILSDWVNTTGVTISPGVQLYFRWNADEYEQCLPFLQDGGTYALARSGNNMITGNTETEGFDVPEQSAIYRIECGGQINGEFGVDERAIEVNVK